ncbi:hypothetical protein M0R45_026572 [Rubus argutus]|uniref:Uncharacterized protein n=1 Tax=Rubus argutus TaxID=59490 RepID=A0AAW1WXZ9_RUBAR
MADTTPTLTPPPQVDHVTANKSNFVDLNLSEPVWKEIMLPSILNPLFNDIQAFGDIGKDKKVTTTGPIFMDLNLPKPVWKEIMLPSILNPHFNDIQPSGDIGKSAGAVFHLIGDDDEKLMMEQIEQYFGGKVPLLLNTKDAFEGALREARYLYSETGDLH